MFQFMLDFRLMHCYFVKRIIAAIVQPQKSLDKTSCHCRPLNHGLVSNPGKTRTIQGLKLWICPFVFLYWAAELCKHITHLNLAFSLLDRMYVHGTMTAKGFLKGNND